jgi:hypothetical protein
MYSKITGFHGTPSITQVGYGGVIVPLIAGLQLLQFTTATINTLGEAVTVGAFRGFRPIKSGYYQLDLFVVAGILGAANWINIQIVDDAGNGYVNEYFDPVPVNIVTIHAGTTAFIPAGVTVYVQFVIQNIVTLPNIFGATAQTSFNIRRVR